MTLQQAYKSIITRPSGKRNDPFYVPLADWRRMRDEVEAYQKERGEPVWEAESLCLNFKFAGVEFRIKE
jgi:hypothetical protein